MDFLLGLQADADQDSIMYTAERNSFQSIMAYNHHVLGPLLPTIVKRHYNLQQKAHDFVLPSKEDDKITYLGLSIGYSIWLIRRQMASLSLSHLFLFHIYSIIAILVFFPPK